MLQDILTLVTEAESSDETGKGIADQYNTMPDGLFYVVAIRRGNLASLWSFRERWRGLRSPPRCECARADPAQDAKDVGRLERNKCGWMGSDTLILISFVSFFACSFY